VEILDITVTDFLIGVKIQKNDADKKQTRHVVPENHQLIVDYLLQE
jgi:hypothetical protein